MSLKTENSRRVAKSRLVCMGLKLVRGKIRREKVGSVDTFLLFARTNPPSGERALNSAVIYAEQQHDTKLWRKTFL
jgi:hypothetical protein